MRVEPAPYVYRPDDRRQRPDDRRAEMDRRRDAPEKQMVNTAPAWFAPAFGAHILGQMAPEVIAPGNVARAYAQPEVRAPRQPLIVTAV